MIKICIILVICYVIITSTDSRSMNMFENKFINDRNGSKYILQTHRFNNTDEESKNVTTSEHITQFELTGPQNNSHVSNINQTSAIEDKFINNKENKTKEFFDPLNGRTYEKEFRTGHDNATEESKNITDSQNIINVNLTYLQNNSKISNVSNTNQTSIDDKSMKGKKNETKEFFDPLNSTTYQNDFRTGFNNATEKLKNITVPQNIIYVNLTDLQINSENLYVQNQTSVIEDKSININETEEFLDPLSGRTEKPDLTPNFFSNPENNVITNNSKSVISEVIGNRISTTAIMTLAGGSAG